MIFEILDLTLISCFLVALAAAAMTAYVGFGGALVMVPLLTFLLGPVQAVALTGICSLIGLVQVIPSLVRLVKWSEVLPVFLGLLVSVSIGSHFLVTAHPDTIRLWMGAFILVAAAILMSDLKYAGPRGVGPSLAAGAVTGGIMGGAGVPAGPILVIYYLASSETAAVQRANILLSVWLLLGIMLANLILRDAVETTTFLRAGLTVPASILGAFLGQHLFSKAPVTWFRKLAHWLLLAIGASLLII